MHQHEIAGMCVAHKADLLRLGLSRPTQCISHESAPEAFLYCLRHTCLVLYFSSRWIKVEI